MCPIEYNESSNVLCVCGLVMSKWKWYSILVMTTVIHFINLYLSFIYCSGWCSCVVEGIHCYSVVIKICNLIFNV
jgi:hypothetical protein